MPINRVPNFAGPSVGGGARFKPQAPSRQPIYGLPRDTGIAKFSLEPGSIPGTRTNHVLHVTARSIDALEGTIRMRLEPLAFQSPYLDQFNRANEAPLNSANLQAVSTGATAKIVSNHLETNNTPPTSGTYVWLPPTDADCEAWITGLVLPTADSLILGVRRDKQGLDGTPINSYECSWNGDGTLSVGYRTAGAYTGLDNTTVTFASGDSFGIRVIGTTIQVYTKQSGVVTLRLTVTDSRYTNAGYVYMGFFSNAGGLQWDDFGGGNAFLETPILTDSFVTYDLAIPDVHAAEIVDYTALEAWIWGHSVLGEPVTFEVSEVYLTVPAMAGVVTTDSATVYVDISVVTPVVTYSDDFNRASIGSNWGTGFGDAALPLVSNQIKGTSAATWYGGYYIPSDVLTDFTYQMDVVAVPTGSDYAFLNLRARLHSTGGAPTGAWDGYAFAINPSAWQFQRVDANIATVLGTGTVGPGNQVQAGDTIKVICHSNTFRVIRTRSGVDTELGVFVESTYASGWAGAEVFGTSAILDNFSINELVDLAVFVDPNTVYVDITTSATENAQFTDSATVYVDIQASGVDTAQFTDSNTVYVDVQPSGSDTIQAVESNTVYVDIQASDTQVFDAVDANTVYVDITCSGTDVADFVDAAMVPVAITPSGVEQRESSDINTIYVDLTTSGTDVAVFTDASTVYVDIQASDTQVFDAVDANTVRILITPSATDVADFVDANTVYVDITTSATDIADFVDSNTVYVDISLLGPPQISVTDNYNRSNESPLASPWTAPSGSTAFDLTSNVVVPTGLSGGSWPNNGAIYTGRVWAADQGSKAKLAVVSTQGVRRGPGLFVRHDLAANTNYRFTTDHAATNNCNISRFVGGVRTTILDFLQPWTDGDTWEFWADGPANATRLRVFLNGVQVAEVTDNSSLAGGYPGIAFSGGTLITSASIDDWTGFELLPDTAQFVDTNTPYVDITASATEQRESTDADTVYVDLTPSSADVAVFVDSATAYVLITPSSTEFRESADTAEVYVDLSISTTDVADFTDTGTVSVLISPSSTDTAALVESATVPVIITPSSVDTADFVDADTVYVLLTPSSDDILLGEQAAEVYVDIQPSGTEVLPGIDEGTVPVYITPYSDDVLEAVDADTVYVLLTPTTDDVADFSDQDTVPVLISPSAVEYRTSDDSAEVYYDILPSGTDDYTQASGYNDFNTVYVDIDSIPVDIEEGVDAATVVLLVTPSSTDIAQFTDSATVGYSITPTGTDARISVDADTVYFGITPSGTEVQETSQDTATVRVVLTPSSTEQYTVTEVGTVTVHIYPSGVEQYASLQQDTGTVYVDIRPVILYAVIGTLFTRYSNSQISTRYSGTFFGRYYNAELTERYEELAYV